MRVVFDVNILIRVVLRSAKTARVFNRTVDAHHAVLATELLISEFAATVRKPRACYELLVDPPMSGYGPEGLPERRHG